MITASVVWQDMGDQAFHLNLSKLIQLEGRWIPLKHRICINS